MPSKSSLPNNFCVLPWVGVHTRNDPVITPCCDYSNTPDIYKGHNIKEYQNSDSLKTVKDQFLKGEWPAGCWKCKEREERSGHSLRIQAMHNYKGHSRKEELYLDDFVTSKNDKYFKLNLAFSNICNLGCVMCVPSNSSFFWEEKTKYDPHHFFDRSSYDPNAPKTPIKHHIEKPIPKKNTQKNPCIDNYTKEDLNNLINSMDMDANPQIQLHGGEPSIMYQSIYFLQKLEEKKYTNIQLEFNSNFQHYNYKFFDKLKNFSKGHALVSIDAIGVPGEYIRYPSNWNEVFSNVIKFKNEHGDRFRITICPTMQILNIFYIDKLVNWTNQFNFNLYLTNNVIQPSYFAINNLPERAKEYLTNKIKKMNYCPDDSTDDMRHTVINLLNSDPTDDLEYTIFKLNQIDSIRDTNWKQSFPELANYIL